MKKEWCIRLENVYGFNACYEKYIGVFGGKYDRTRIIIADAGGWCDTGWVCCRKREKTA